MQRPSTSPTITMYQQPVRKLADLLKRIAMQLSTKDHPDSQIRHAILIHSSLRASRSAEAQILLSANLFAEEIHSLNRTLSEICINAAYLQFAAQAELDSYLSHDSSVLARVLLRISSTPNGNRMSVTEERKIRKLAEQPLPVKQLGWCAKSPMHRANAVDKACSVESLMRPVALVVYETAHPYVHGTASSVARVGDWLIQGAAADDSSRNKSTLAALNNTAICLLAMCSFIGGRYGLKVLPEIAEIKKELNELAID